jgi:hypothetical protein
VAVNNEGRELNDYRIRQFGLNTFFDAFVSSCYVHFRKPDADIFRLALDVAQVDPAAGGIPRRPQAVRAGGRRAGHALHAPHRMTPLPAGNWRSGAWLRHPQPAQPKGRRKG